MHINKMAIITFYWQHLRNRADLLVLHALPEVFVTVCLSGFSRGKSNNASPEAWESTPLLAVITIPDISMVIAAAKTNETELTC